jgi:hypothetical protein
MEGKPSVFLHLSDIHFCRSISGSKYDLDIDLRNELERDATEMVNRHGSLDRILVTGDIAFAGNANEYDLAGQWLSELCKKLDCPTENVWTTPGNHDIDRFIIEKSSLLTILHKEIRTCKLDEIDGKIYQLFYKDKEAASLLLQPIQKYNEFARRFGCAVNGESLFWEDDQILNDGSKLRLVGLNSTIISDGLDNDAENRLILGSVQVMLPREDGVAYLTLCHHPPDWLRDKDTIEKKLTNRARVQLFGHKHIQSLIEIDGNLRIIAGATHPVRTEKKWQPRYNFLLISVGREGENRTLNVSVFPRVWNDEKAKFVADHTERGMEERRFSFPLDNWKPTVSIEKLPDPAKCSSDIKGNQGKMSAKSTTSQEERKMDFARKLTYRFLSLSYYIRIKIALDLGLILDEDKKLDDEELLKQVFRRAKESNKLKELWDKIEEAHGDNSKTSDQSSGKEVKEG